ncbi:MAG: extracellular solute-binding protein [Leifsonia sp.]
MGATKRSVIGIVAVATVAVLLAGCSAGTSTDAKKTATPADTTGTLRVLVPSYPASTEGEAAFQKVVDTFHKTYPDITVQPDFATFGNLNQKISTSIAGGQPYDVIVSGVGWVPPFASKKAFLNLAKFGVTPTTLAKEVAPAIIPAVTYNKAAYAYPLILGAKPLALSRSAFTAAGLDPNKPPTNLAELEKDAKLLTQKDSSGKITRAGFDFWAAPGAYRQDFVALLGALGKNLYTDGKPNFDNAQGKQALGFIKGMIDDGVIAYGQTSASGSPLLYTGQAAMGFVGGYIDCKAVTQAVCDDLKFFNLQDDKKSMFSGGQLASIGSQSKLAGPAWSFIKALSTPSAEAEIAALNFAVPAAAGSDKSEVVTGNPASKFSYANLSHVVFEGGTANWLDLRNEFGTDLDQALLGKATTADVLAKLAADSK